MPIHTEIIDLKESDLEHVSEISYFLFDCFKKYSPEWLPNLEMCHDEIVESFAPDRKSRVMVDSEGVPIGWIGAIIDRDVWEIHPIAVSKDHQQNGLGKQLVLDIENLARQSGASAVWAGTSDETNSTSFSRIDLYKEPELSFRNIEAPDDHPVRFWLGAGYSIVGVMPDDEGLGKPGIHFAKRVV